MEALKFVKFHHLPTITREEIVLPQQLLERIERHTIRAYYR